MFSVRQKREIADAVQQILRSTNHPELPEGEIEFRLHVAGAGPMAYADIRNNGAVPEPEINPTTSRWIPAHDGPGPGRPAHQYPGQH